ncbi:MAG: spore germination protein GerW family protein [bacterium]|nr:spore germination protein GerW family protein [bacterium]
MESKTPKKSEKISQETSNILERMAQRLGAHANTKAVYGDPVEKDGVTLIPVAKVGYGFGGGGWHGGKDEGGNGGGGGMGAAPMGYIQIKNGKSQFRRIHLFDWAAFGFGVLLGGWLLNKFRRRSSR